VYTECALLVGASFTVAVALNRLIVWHDSDPLYFRLRYAIAKPFLLITAEWRMDAI
jgi:hypothetical protein